MQQWLKKCLSSDAVNTDLGLLILRVGIGLSMLIFHGWSKLTGGVDMWTRLGGSMENLGITFLPVMWGFMAAASESIGSALLVVGLFFRPAAGLLAVTMAVAMVRHLSLPADVDGAGWKGASHAIELLAVYVALLLTGPGKYALMRPRPDSGSGSDSE